MILETVWDGTDCDQTEEGSRLLEVELIRFEARMGMVKLASHLAHEMTQPLGAIANYAQGCKQRLRQIAGVPDDVLLAMDRIVVQAGRAGEILHSTCNRVHGSQTAPRRIQLDDLVSEVVALVSSEAHQAGVVLRVQCPENLPPLFARPLPIQHVLLTLVRNGLEAMADQEAGKRELTIQAFENVSGDVQVAVSDRGRGLQEETRTRLFQPFFTTKPGRLGLNLAICKSIIEAHDGKVWATANVREGAVFQFTLPRAQRDAANRPASGGFRR